MSETNSLTSDCPDCAALREQNRRLSGSNLVLIDRNVALASRVRAFEERDRMGAEMLLGLADLQKVEAGR